MNNLKAFCIAFHFLLLVLPVKAQPCISLDDIIQEFASTNNDLITLNEKMKIQCKLYQNNQDKWKPSTKLEVALPYSNSIESVISGDGNVNYLKRNYLNPLLSISTAKKISLTGGEIGINGSLGLFHNFLNNNKQFNANWFNVYVSQPLFAYNEMKADRVKQRISLCIDSIQYYKGRETKLKSIVEAILDYEIAKQRIIHITQQFTEANYALQRTKTLYQLGRVLAEDTILIAYNLSKVNLEMAKLLDDLKAKQLFLTSQLSKNYDYSLCELFTIPNLQIDSSELRRLYLNYGFQKELIIDSIDAFENTIKMKKAHGITISILAGIGANNSSTDINQLYNSPSQRQNITLNATVPLTGWQTYKRNNQIALMEQQNYERAKQDIKNSAAQWAKETYNNYKYLVQSYNLAKSNLEGLKALANSVFKRYEVGRASFTEYASVLNEISNTEEGLLNIIKQLYILRFELRTKTLFDFTLSKDVF